MTSTSGMLAAALAAPNSVPIGSAGIQDCERESNASAYTYKGMDHMQTENQMKKKH
jgi:hypothetical protein